MSGIACPAEPEGPDELGRFESDSDIGLLGSGAGSDSLDGDSGSGIGGAFAKGTFDADHLSSRGSHRDSVCDAAVSLLATSTTSTCTSCPSRITRGAASVHVMTEKMIWIRETIIYCRFL